MRRKISPNSKTQVVFLNLITDIVPKILVCILGIVKIKLFLNALGQEQLGMYQLYGQILSYLILAEGGVGTAILYRLFKLVEEKDNKKINNFMASAKVIFRSVTIIMLIIGTIITFFIPLFVKEYETTTIFLCSTFFLYMVSEVITYITIPEKSRFDAEQKRYIPNVIAQTAQLIRMILEIVAILLTRNLYIIIGVVLLVNLATCIVNKIIYKKYFGTISYRDKKDLSVIKDCKHLTVNTVANLISSNIDIILISKFIGLSDVVIYSAYNYIVDNIRKILESLMGATMSSVANIVLKSKTKAYEIFSEYTALCYWVATILCIPIFVSINSFIRIWYEGDIFTSFGLALLFSVILFFNIVKLPTRTFTFAAGKFQLIKKYVIFEIIMNLGLSILLVNKIGMYGVLVATILSYIVCDFIPKTIIVLKEITTGDKKRVFLDQLVFMGVALLEGVVVTTTFLYQPDNIILWALYSGGIFITVLILTTAFYALTKKIDFKERLKILRKK